MANELEALIRQIVSDIEGGKGKCYTILCASYIIYT